MGIRSREEAKCFATVVLFMIHSFRLFIPYLGTSLV